MSDKNPHTDAETSPTRSVHHDVLVINPNHELYRFNVCKTDVGRAGEYESIEFRGPGAPGYRKVMHIARKGSLSKARGVAFATLPVKEEPASSFMCCYLINSENLTYRNVWTQAEWNDAPDTGDGEPGHAAHPRDVRLLVADHSGRVLYLNIPKNKLKQAELGWVLTPLKRAGNANLQAISLQQNPEIWNLLRNGCVAGSATYDGQDTPLLNLTSLLPEREERHHERAEPSDDQITGTLDFKWSHRARGSGRREDIVVAFLPVPTSAYGLPQHELFELFKSYAERWKLSKLGIDVRFETERAFDPQRPFDYDVLVALAPLDGSVKDDHGQAVTIPMSELGSYACRVDRGVATFFAGMPRGLKDVDGGEMKAPRYPTSAAFQQFVVHEFGHALGLVHLHQHAELNRPAMKRLRSELGAKSDIELDEKLRGMIKKELGIEVPKNYVDEAVRGTWPGNDDYSEWPELGSDSPSKLLELLDDSIMTGLGAHAKGCMGGLAPNQYRTKPSELDIQWLQSLYPRYT